MALSGMNIFHHAFVATGPKLPCNKYFWTTISVQAARTMLQQTSCRTGSCTVRSHTTNSLGSSSEMKETDYQCLVQTCTPDKQIFFTLLLDMPGAHVKKSTRDYPYLTYYGLQKCYELLQIKYKSQCMPWAFESLYTGGRAMPTTEI